MARWQTREEPTVVRYCADLDRMHKIVLGADNEPQLRKLSQDLADKGESVSSPSHAPTHPPALTFSLPLPL